MLGTIVNTLTVIVGSLIGVFLKKGISQKVNDTVMKGLALMVMYIGISGSLTGKNTLVAIISIAVGAIIGEWLDLEEKLNGLGKRLEDKVSKGKGDGSLAKGFVTASLLFCVGAMSIVGSLEGGLLGKHETIFAKALLDGIAAIVLSSTLGIGVIFSAGIILLYQGGIALGAGLLEPILTETIIAEMTSVGSLLIIGLSLNMLGITKIKVMNYVPAIFMPIFIYWVMELF